MKIVQVSIGNVRMPPMEGSAPQQVIFNLSKNIARMGHEVVILDRKYLKDDPEVEQIEGVQIARLSVMQIHYGKVPRIIHFLLAELNAVLFTLVVSRYLKNNAAKIDVIHLHLTSIGLIVIILNRALRGIIFYTCHLSQWSFVNSGLSISEKVHLLLDAFLMRRVRKVIALNETAKESFISFGKVDGNSIIVLQNGVDTASFSPNLEVADTVRKKYGMGDKLAVLFVGRLARIKGVEHLVRAANIVVNEFGCKDTLFVLAGPQTYPGVDEPVNIEEMLGFIKHNQLDRNIVLTGSLPLQEVKGLYAASNIFVLPSLAEGDPLVTIEAMASGKPVIGTRVGGIPHQIRDGWNGFLIDPANEQQLADKIKYLIDNPDERKRMGENSRRYAEEEFDWSKVAEKLLLAYKAKAPAHSQ